MLASSRASLVVASSIRSDGVGEGMGRFFFSASRSSPLLLLFLLFFVVQLMFVGTCEGWLTTSNVTDVGGFVSFFFCLAIFSLSLW